MRITRDLLLKGEPEIPWSRPIYLELPPNEKNGKVRYVLQHHWRSRSVHWDFRLEVNNHLIGWSVAFDEPVIVRRNGMIEILPAECVINFDGIGFEIKKEVDGLEILTGNGFRKVKRAARHIFEHDLVRVVTRRGAIEVTPSHSLFQNGTPIRAGDLKKGDSIDLAELQVDIPNLEVDKDWAWLLGYFCADGYAARRKQWEAWISDEDLSKLKLAKRKLIKFGIPSRIERQDKNCWRLRILWAQPLFFNLCYVVNKNTSTHRRYKIVPKLILNADKDARDAFLDGFYTGDGHPDGSGMSFSIHSKALGAGILFLETNRGRDFGISSVRKYNSLNVYVYGRKRKPLKPPDEIIDIYKVNRGRNCYVYDFETEDGTFIAGVGKILAHNTILDNPKIDHAPTLDELPSLINKLDWTFRPVPGMNNRKCRCETKARQPKTWLFWKGGSVVPFDQLWKFDVGDSYEVIESLDKLIVKMDTGETFEVKPGSVGATRYKPGRFLIVDKGYVTFGAQKPWYHEYFLDSIAKKKHKLTFEKIRVNMRAVKQAVIDPETKKPKPGKFELMWETWVPRDQDPYAVKRGKRTGWVPPKGFIPIPKWWIEKNRQKFEEWFEWVKERWGETKELLKAEAEYSLQQMSWKGQKVIRDIPVMYWFLNIKQGNKIRTWELWYNPLYVHPTAAGYIGQAPKKWFEYEGKLKPGELFNPRKRLNADVRILDKGTVYVDAKRVNGKEVLILSFSGKLGKFWKLEQEERGSDLYSFSKSNIKKASGSFVLQRHVWKGGSHFDIRIDEGEDYLIEWSLKKDPRKYGIDESEVVMLKKCYDKAWMEAEGKRKVGGVWTDVHILDRGKVDFIEKSQLFRSFMFHGDSLKGYYVLKSDGKTWRFIRSALPGMEKELKYEDKATFIRIHLHDIRDFTRCESEEKAKRYKIPKLPEGVEANICLYPRPGTVHGARIQSLKFDKNVWSIERIKREFDFKPYIEWQGVQVRG